MSENVDKITEKVYCTGHPTDNSAMWAAMMNNQNTPAEIAAMMNGGMGGWGGMQWLVWLYAMRWLGDDRNKDNAQLAALQNQISDNQNINNVTAAIQNNASAMREIANATNTNIDFVKQSLCNLNAALQDVGGRVGLSAERIINSVVSGDASITSTMQNCCCQTQQAVRLILFGNTRKQRTIHSTRFFLKQRSQTVRTNGAWKWSLCRVISATICCAQEIRTAIAYSPRVSCTST